MSLSATPMQQRGERTVRSNSMDEQSSRGAVGRAVLEALEEIDRAVQATLDAASSPGGARLDATTALYSNAPGVAARNAASLIGAGASIRVTGRQARRA